MIRLISRIWAWNLQFWSMAGNFTSHHWKWVMKVHLNIQKDTSNFIALQRNPPSYLTSLHMLNHSIHDPKNYLVEYESGWNLQNWSMHGQSGSQLKKLCSSFVQHLINCEMITCVIDIPILRVSQINNRLVADCKINETSREQTV